MYLEHARALFFKHSISDERPRTWCELSLSAFKHNAALFASELTSSPVIIMIPAHAYGHDPHCLALLARDQSFPSWWCTTTLSQARALLSYGVTKPIIALYDPLFSLTQPLDPRIRLGIFSDSMLEDVARLAQHASLKVPVHLIIDTGTGFGLSLSNLTRCAQRLPRSYLIEGLMTHLALGPFCAAQEKQLELLETAAVSLRKLGLDIPFVWARGATHTPSPSFLTLQCVEDYGYGLPLSPQDDSLLAQKLKPLLSWKTKLIAIKKISSGMSVGYNRTYTASGPMSIGIIPIGYADGLARALSNTSSVLIGGKPAPLIGLISMNLATIDLTTINHAAQGDEITLIGSHPSVTAKARAHQLGLKPVDVTARIASTVPRLVID